MSRTASPHQPSVGRAPLHTVQVLGVASAALGGVPSAGTAAHVRSLAEGLVARGVRVTVCVSQDAELDHEFTGTGACFAAARGRTEPETAASLRAVCADADLVHAHGLRAGLLAALALGGRRHEVPLVVTWHTQPQPAAGEGRGPDGRARGLALRFLRRRVARVASVILGATADLVDSARACGARDARLAPVALPGPRGAERPHPNTGPPSGAPARCTSADGSPREPAQPGASGAPSASGVPGAAVTSGAPGPSSASRGAADPVGCTSRPPGTQEPTQQEPTRPEGGGETELCHKVRAELGAMGRPLVVAVGRLDGRHGFGTVLTASRAWRYLDPQPLIAIAGEGPERAALQGRIEAEELPVRLLGRRGDALRLLAGADVALVSARWEGRSVSAQEALRAGTPLVATEVGGIPELVGEAAVLTPYGDADALASAVTALLSDPGRRAALAEAGRARSATWPTEDDTVAQVLSVYDELTRAQVV